MDVTRAFPAAYGVEDAAGVLEGNNTALLLGVTGGIATGKTTVAEMLEQLGAPSIDFDVLSRVVVEPDKPAWRDIVGFFGDQVLLEDRTLDRQALRSIVFEDSKKKKALENFTHPRIGGEFIRLVRHHTERDPNAIIQAVVPLLVETGMHSLFHKTLMVYAPEREQRRRLMERDGVTEEMAMNMIRSQLSVEEKKRRCDLIIDNSGPLRQTRHRVEELWEELKRMQRARKVRIESR